MINDKKYYEETAKNYFLEGYNCAQSVFLTFLEFYGLDKETAAKISASFGGGMGRLREVCGAVSGMFMAAGLLYGYSEPGAFEKKKQHYERIQKLAEEFRNKNGSIVCRELLGLPKGPDKPEPEKRTEQYYKKRPCGEMIAMAAGIFSDYIRENPLPDKNE